MASVDQAIRLTFTPDGRMLVISKDGKLWVYKGGQLLQTPALDISSRICSNGDRRLVDVVVDPNFPHAGTSVWKIPFGFRCALQ